MDEGKFNRIDALLPQAEQEELNQLRRDQFNGNDWTEAKRTRLLELQEKANAVQEQRRIK